jgi:hypothetical protein
MARVSASSLLRPVVCLYLSSSSSRALLHTSRRRVSRHAYSSLTVQSNHLGGGPFASEQTSFARRTISLSASSKGGPSPDNDNMSDPPKTRISPRKRVVKGSTESASNKKTKKANADDDGEPKKKKVNGRPKKKSAVAAIDEANDDVEESKEVAKKKAVKKVVKKKAASSDDEDGSPKKKAAAADHQRLTERDELPKLWNGKDHEDTSHSKLLSLSIRYCSFGLCCSRRRRFVSCAMMPFSPFLLILVRSIRSLQDLFMERGRDPGLDSQPPRSTGNHVSRA